MSNGRYMILDGILNTSASTTLPNTRSASNSQTRNLRGNQTQKMAKVHKIGSLSLKLTVESL